MNYSKTCERINLAALITPDDAKVIRDFITARKGHAEIVETYGQAARKPGRPYAVPGLEVMPSSRPKTEGELWADTKAGRKFESEKKRAGDFIAKGKAVEATAVIREAQAEFEATKHILHAAAEARKVAGFPLEGVCRGLVSRINAAIDECAAAIGKESAAAILPVIEAVGVESHNAGMIGEHVRKAFLSARIHEVKDDHYDASLDGDPGEYALRLLGGFRDAVVATVESQGAPVADEAKPKGKKISAGVGATTGS